MRKHIIVFTAVAVVVTILALPTLGFAALPDSATMQFGQPDKGSGCNFPCDDDASFHAIDKIIPGAVAISAGATVHFEVNGFHRVAIYEPGITPKDIEPDAASFPFVNDPNGRIFRSAAPTVDAEFTFDVPGKYLVICDVTPHFEESDMWGWVIVE